MMRTPRRVTPFATIAALALTLAACGDDDAPRPVETVTVTESATSSPSSSSASSAPEQRQLTDKEIAAALPTREDAPSGFDIDSRGFDTSMSGERTTDPTACLALYMSTQEQLDFSEEHLAASDGVRFTHKEGEPGSPSISIAVWSFDEPYPQEFLDTAGAALGECQKFTTKTSPDDSPADWTADTIPTPTLGEQSFGVRIGRPDVDIAIDYIWVRSGHNLVHARMLTGYRQNNDSRLQRYTQAILDDLKENP